MDLNFIRNIRKFLSQENLSIAEFAGIIGEKTSRVNDVLKGKQRPPFDMLQKIIEKFDIDANWLILGSGEVQNWNSSSNEKYSDELDYVPDYDVLVSAGMGIDGQGTTSPRAYQAFRRDWLHQRGLHARNLSIVTARGDSMEPTIRKGDIVFLDTKVNAYSGDGIYAFAIDGALFIKRIQKMIGGGYRMISDNEIYPPEQISDDVCENAKFIGRFIRTIHIEAVNL